MLNPQSIILLYTLILSEINRTTSFSRGTGSKTAFESNKQSLPRRILDTTSLKAHDGLNKVMDRRSTLKDMTSLLFLWSQGRRVVEAKVSSNIKPDVAFTSIVKAREELQAVSNKYLKTKNYDGLKNFLSDPMLNINNFEDNANALLASKELDAESKKEIGTIRRYGVGADVIIMYGGLKTELEEDDMNSSNVSKLLQRAMDSLDEVIAICRSNGF